MKDVWINQNAIYDNLKITDVYLEPKKLYGNDEIIEVNTEYIYRYTLGNKLTGEEEIDTRDIEKAKRIITERILKYLEV